MSKKIARKLEVINRDDLPSIINGLRRSGRMFTIGFIKDDGYYRPMNGRLNVKSRLNGGSPRVNAPGKFTMFDAKVDNYRTANMNTAHFLVADRHVYIVV